MLDHLNLLPTQMAIPLQMDEFPKQLVAATRARMRGLP
jgi:hypothetical protein